MSLSGPKTCYYTFFCVWDFIHVSFISAAGHIIFISTLKLTFRFLCSATAPLFMCIVSLSRYSCLTCPAPIKSGSFKTNHLQFFALGTITSTCTFNHVRSIIQNGTWQFQHREEDFLLKCLAVSFGLLRTTYFRLFDTSSLLSRAPAALQTCQYQTRHHALGLASAGLPQAMARLLLMHAILKEVHRPSGTRRPCAGPKW